MRRQWVVWVTLALLLLGGRVAAATESTGAYNGQLCRKAQRYFLDGSFREAARWYFEAEQVSADDKTKSRLAYFAGAALLKAGRYNEAVAPLERAISHDREGKFAGFARIAIKECRSLQEPWSDFPDGLYLWVTHRSGSDGVRRLDQWLDAWDRVKWPVVAFPFLFWGGLALLRRLRHRRA